MMDPLPIFSTDPQDEILEDFKDFKLGMFGDSVTNGILAKLNKTSPTLVVTSTGFTKRNVFPPSPQTPFNLGWFGDSVTDGMFAKLNETTNCLQALL